MDVAIVGMACKFPGAPDLLAFWENIVAGRDAIGDVPTDRWDPSVFFDPKSSENDRVYSRRGGYLDGPIPFDPSAHGIMPKTVDGGEPEQFLILDAARAALVDAGLEGIDGRRVEVVIGRGNYFNRGNLTRLQHGRIVAQTLAILRALHPEWTEADLDAVRADLKASLPPFGPETIPGQLTNATAGRVANRLDLAGASFVVDAASASALVALDLGARALIEKRADLALVGAVYLAADVDFPMVFCQLGALSRQGHAKPFGRDADGTLPGEGVGVVVLKRLDDAERDGDRVYAVVKGTGLASDGRGLGLAAPNARGHARAMVRAYQRAGVDPGTVGLIEGHGLGVPAADRAELRALRAVFPPSRSRALGAVSSMIGHAMPAAGMAGMIKSALALHHRLLPPTLHAEDAHPWLARDDSPATLNRSTRPWIQGDPTSPRRVGVNAFGFAGISAHAVLEEHPRSADGDTPGCMTRWENETILLGATDRAEWLELARALLEWLDQKPDVPLKDVAYTLNNGQPPFPFRVGIVAASLDDLADRLRGLIKRLADPDCRSIRDARGLYFRAEPLAGPGKIAFLFPGEGSQYPGMLADLCPHFPEVRALFDTADRIARERGHARLPSEHLFGGRDVDDPGLWGIGTAINVVLSAQWALYQLLTKLGLRPDAIAGHSSGEILALAAAGVLRIEQRLEDRLGEIGAIFEHLEATGDVPAATLLAVAADRERVEAACRDVGETLVVAMDNCPHQVVVAGPPASVEALATRLRGQGIVCEVLPFARAYHTPAFAAALGPVREFFDDLPMLRPRVPFYSCATAARVLDDPESIRRLAVEQWTRPVAFRETIEAMHADGVRVFVEVGARGNLTGFVEDILRGRPAFAVAANLPRRSGPTQLNHLVASLFAQGVAIKTDHLYARRRPSRIDFGAEPTRTKPAPALAVGFPEMRLSAELIGALSGLRAGDHGSNGLQLRVEPGHVPASRPMSGAMRAYIETMDMFLDTQREVMDAYLGANIEGSPLVDRIGPGLPADSSVGQTGISAPPGNPAPHEGVSPERALLETVGRRTGYPLEMLGLELDMEGDLGIDSIKRVEILGELRERGVLASGVDLDRLAVCRTLRQVLDVLGSDRSRAELEPGPWVGEVRSLVPGRELVTVRWLDATDDPVAEHHTLGGRRVSAIDLDRKGLPVVPFTVMAEMLAEAGSVLAPGRTLTALRDVQAHKWIKYEEEPVALEVRAHRDPSRPDEVRVEIHNKGTARVPRAGVEGPAVAGLAVFGADRIEAPIAGPADLPDPAPCRFTAHELYDDQWLFHGPALRALARVGASSPEGIEGTLRVLPRRALLREGETAKLLTDPIVLDAFTHLLGCWGLDRMREGDVMFPLRMGELTIFDAEPPEGADVACRIRIREVDRNRVRADAEFVGPDGRVWMRLAGWEDWRFHWPSRYRDVFRQPDRIFLGEPLPLPESLDGQVRAVWMEPPADMGKPVWRDVLEWVHLGPAERAAFLAAPGPDARRTLRLWGRLAAKEAVRRLGADYGRASVYPADLSIEHDGRGRPRIRSLLHPERVDAPAISIAHAEGVAVALAALDPETRVGIDVERIVEREPGFESIAFRENERALLDEIAGPVRAEWVARFWCAKEAAAKATGLGLVAGPASVAIVAAHGTTGIVSVAPGNDLAPAWPVADGSPVKVMTARRGDYAWAWTLGEPMT